MDTPLVQTHLVLKYEKILASAVGGDYSLHESVRPKKSCAKCHGSGTLRINSATAPCSCLVTSARRAMRLEEVATAPPVTPTLKSMTRNELITRKKRHDRLTVMLLAREKQHNRAKKDLADLDQRIDSAVEDLQLQADQLRSEIKRSVRRLLQSEKRSEQRRAEILELEERIKALRRRDDQDEELRAGLRNDQEKLRVQHAKTLDQAEKVRGSFYDARCGLVTVVTRRAREVENTLRKLEKIE
jgi:chromosome segregation ATPase